MRSPRCGNEQAEAPECARCGIVFARYRPRAAPEPPSPHGSAAGGPADAPARPGGLLTPFLVVLAALGLVAVGVVRLSGPRRDLFELPKTARRRPTVPIPTEPPSYSFRGAAPAPAARPVGVEPPVGSVPGAEAPPTPTIDVLSLYPSPAPRPVSGSWRTGASGYDEAAAEAKASGAPLVLYFYTDWCGFCRRLDSTYLTSPELQAFLSSAAKARVNPESGEAERELASRFGVRGYPAFFVFPSGGGGPRRVHPFRGGGDATPADFAAECRRAAG